VAGSAPSHRTGGAVLTLKDAALTSLPPFTSPDGLRQLLLQLLHFGHGPVNLLLIPAGKPLGSAPSKEHQVVSSRQRHAGLPGCLWPERRCHANVMVTVGLPACLLCGRPGTNTQPQCPTRPVQACNSASSFAHPALPCCLADVAFNPCSPDQCVGLPCRQLLHLLLLGLEMCRGRKQM